MAIINRQSGSARSRSEASRLRGPYTIDLLQGEGLPIRSRPGGIVFACLIIVLPLLAAFGAANVYVDSDVVITIQKQQAGRLATAIQALSSAVRKRETLESQKTEATHVLSDVKASLDGHNQWSPILASLVESLSDTLILTRLEARRDTVRIKVPAPDDPTRKIETSIPVRALKICVCGKDKESSAEAVRRVQDNLRSAPALGPLLDTVTVSQDATTLDGQEAVLYEFNCVFKPAAQKL
jgi:Tfp pilus assembly protein PilN